ncbi:hypothetical protein BH10ACT3_BH10ACT3_18290 [soil metagenome]
MTDVPPPTGSSAPDPDLPWNQPQVAYPPPTEYQAPPTETQVPAVHLPVHQTMSQPIQQPVHDAGSASLQPDPILFTIGDIAVTQHWVVTPNGTAPIGGSAWIANDRTTTSERIPAYAIVLAIIFALACLLGLLFLLIKQHTTTGYVEVQVRSGSLFHTTQIPVSNQLQVTQVRQQVAQAQTVAARAV